MNEMYELGKIAAIADLEDAAFQGDELAIKIASALPEELQMLPREVKTAAWEMQEKVAGAKEVWNSVKGHADKAWKATKDYAGKATEGVKKYHSGMKEDFLHAVKGSKDAPKGSARAAKSNDNWKERSKSLGRAALKATPHAAGVGAVGYGVHKAMED